jgi:DNA polymerase III epsilon subunit-like protein
MKGRSEDWMGANPAFDVGFLRAAKKRTGAKLRIQQRVINLQDLAWMADRLGVIELPEKNGRRSRSLDSILESLGMTRGTLDGPHDALEDCLATFRAWRRMNALWLMKTEVRHE